MRLLAAIGCAILSSCVAGPPETVDPPPRPVHVEPIDASSLTPTFDAFVNEMVRLERAGSWPESIPRHAGRARVRVARALVGRYVRLDPDDVTRELVQRIGSSGVVSLEVGRAPAPGLPPPAVVELEVATPRFAGGGVREYSVLILLRGDGGHVAAATYGTFLTLEP